MQAIILAGGKGTRLAARLNGKPKPLVLVEGVPLLERQLRQLSAKGVDEALILVNHAADQIESFVADHDFGLRTKLIDDGQPRGTAGAVLACLDQLADRFLVVYGDTLFDLDIRALLSAHERSGAEATLLLHPNDHPADSDLVELNEADDIVAFHGYPHPSGIFLPNLVNAAFYCVEKRLLSHFPTVAMPCDFAKDLFPEALRRGSRLHGYRSFEYIKDLGTPSRLDKVEKHLRTGVVVRARLERQQPAVFADRDGTLNELRGYIREAGDLDLIAGTPAAVRRLNDQELRLVVVTNQPVLARGESTFAAMRQIHAKLDTLLGEEGAYIDRLYLCPHHPDAGFPGEVPVLKIRCECRKPNTGMIDQAVKDLNIDRSRSFFVGDSTSDVLAANRAGVRAILVRTGEGGRDGKYQARPDHVVEDFACAVQLIVDELPGLAAKLRPLVDRLGDGTQIKINGSTRSVRYSVASELAWAARERWGEASLDAEYDDGRCYSADLQSSSSTGTASTMHCLLKCEEAEVAAPDETQDVDRFVVTIEVPSSLAAILGEAT